MPEIGDIMEKDGFEWYYDGEFWIREDLIDKFDQQIYTKKDIEDIPDQIGFQIDDPETVAKNTIKRYIDGKKSDEQAKLDTLSRQYNQSRSGGGVVDLNTPSNKYVFDTPKSGIKSLYDQAYPKGSKGSKEAKSLIDRLWDLSIPQLREIEAGRSLSLVGCPKCQNVLTQKDRDLGICPSCGVDIYREYKSKGILI